MAAIVLVAAERGATASGDTSAYRPLIPCRLLDTRQDPPGRLRAEGTVAVHVAGRCEVPAQATAVALTITATATAGPGFVTAFAHGSTRPLASTLNYGTGTSRANGSIVPIGVDGSVDLFTLAAADLVVDVTGAWTPAASASAGRLMPTAPSRLADTRSGPRPAAGTVLRVPLPAEIPPTASALAVNLTVTEAAAPGFLTAFPAGSPVPLASSLNWEAAGQVRAATTIVPVSPQGLEIYLLSAAHVVVDISGWFTGPDAPDTADGLFVPLEPTRVIDTRLAAGPAGGPRLWAGGARELDLRSWVGSAAAIAANLTVVGSDAPGWWLAYPAGAPSGPTGSTEASSINTDRDRQVVANLALVSLSERGLGLYAEVSAHLVVDVSGWFTGPPMPATLAVPANVNWTRQATIISDSASAGMRWYSALGALRGFAADARLESCRRLVFPSCRGREGYTPRTVVAELLALPRPRPSDILFVATGYNDWSSRFSADFDTVIATARAVGFEQIAWMTYRPSTDEVDNGELQRMNAIVASKLASGAYPDVEVWDLARYTAPTVGWYTPDGVHLMPDGAWGMADWISRHVAAADGRPCPVPWAPGLTTDTPCPDPDGHPPADVAGLYGV